MHHPAVAWGVLHKEEFESKQTEKSYSFNVVPALDFTAVAQILCMILELMAA